MTTKRLFTKEIKTCVGLTNNFCFIALIVFLLSNFNHRVFVLCTKLEILKIFLLKIVQFECAKINLIF